ncbi:MAG: tetratricopeptide repeat protein [Proteobacteria bacterium]|nr:tetratricopeptide repeat protein [Pseudomonadota bacterium]
MATFDLEEQDQLDDLKAWWARYGSLIASVITIAALAFIAVQGWRWYQNNHQEAAATLYGAVSEGVRAHDAAKSKDAMAQLADRFASSPYAPRAALLYAKQLWDAGDKAGAKAQLTFALDRASDPAVVAVARYRLAEAALDDGKPDEALKLLDAKVDDSFAGIYADLRGDALAVAGKRDDARAAYQVALAKLDQRSQYRNYVQVKYEALGGTDVPAGAPPPGAPKAATPAAAPAAAASAPAAAQAPATTPAPAAAPAKP